MTVQYLIYPLQDEFIHNWLVAGPLISSIPHTANLDKVLLFKQFSNQAYPLPDVEQVIRDPKHPYTKLLVNSIPWPDPNQLWGEAVEATTKKVSADHVGCKFASRCPHVFDKCLQSQPPLYISSEALLKSTVGHAAACYLYEGGNVLTKDQNLVQLFHK